MTASIRLDWTETVTPDAVLSRLEADDERRRACDERFARRRGQYPFSTYNNDPRTGYRHSMWDDVDAAVAASRNARTHG